MAKQNKKRKNIGELLTYAYIRRIKKWMFCPACQEGKMTINKKSTIWACEDCGYSLSADEFEDDYVFWFCDECNTYLNTQEGFNRFSDKHICKNCGYENDTTFNNIKGICIDCGKQLPDPDTTLCFDCKQIRKEKAKDRLIKVGIAVGVTATIGVATALSSKDSKDDHTNDYTPLSDDDDNYFEEDDEVYGLGPGIYPTCKECGTKMTQFDGWAWYTCPFCENRVRIIEGKETWYDEIFSKGTKEHNSDFALADFCHGGDLTED